MGMRIGSFTGANDTSRYSPVSSQAVIGPTQDESTRRGWLHGLKLVAAAVVAQAILVMAGSLTPDWLRRGVAVGAAAIALMAPSSFIQVALIAAGGLIGLVAIRTAEDQRRSALPLHVSR